jgi:hypothetical protein
MDQPRRTPSIKQRPRLPAPFPRDIRGGRVVGVVSELKAQLRRGCSGAQVWTPSPPIRPHFCPPLRPHLEQSAAADSASTGTGPTPTINWPPRWIRRTRKGGVRRQECVADTSGPTCAGLANLGAVPMTRLVPASAMTQVPLHHQAGAPDRDWCSHDPFRAGVVGRIYGRVAVFSRTRRLVARVRGESEP